MQITKFLVYLFLSSLILVGCSNDDDNSTQENDPSRSANLLGLGTSANDLLSDTVFKSITIEMVSIQGFEPTEVAVNNFEEFLKDRLFKPDGVTIRRRTIASSNKAPFDIDEIREIEQNTRTLFNTGDDITVYIYFADGSNEDDSNEKVTLGTAYLNTSMVIYEGTLRRFAGMRGAPMLSTLETATLNHEFSHLLGLVNIGTPLQSQHESIERGHCNVENCLMEAAIAFSSGIMNMGDIIPQLDPLCIKDLQANGGK